MPVTKQKPVNVYLKPEAIDLLKRLQVSVEEALDIPPSQGHVIHLALKELARKYPPAEEEGGDEPVSSSTAKKARAVAGRR
jgi:hypothetical protein